MALAIAVGGLALGFAVVAKQDLFQLAIPPTPAQLLAVAAATGLALAVVRSPGLGLVLLVAFVYLNLSEVLVRHHGLPSLLQLLFVPLTLAAALAIHRDRLAALAGQGLGWGLVAYGLWITASSTWAWQPSLTDARTLETAKSLGIYLLVVLLANSLTRLRRAARTLVGVGALLAGLGVFQVARGDFRGEFGGLARIKHAQIWGNVFESRIAGPLGDPNYFAQILVVAVPVALALAWKASTLRGRATGYAAAALLAAGTVLTYSRGGALTLVVVLGLFVLVRRPRRRELLVGAALAGVLFVALPSGFTRRLITLEQVLPGGDEALHPDSSFEKRLLVTRTAWRMFLDHPLRGVGAGNYAVHFDTYAALVGSEAQEYDDQAAPNYPHSLYLEIAAETGVVGLALFAAVLLAALAGLLGARRRLVATGDAASAALASGLSIALVGYLVSSLFLHGHFQRYLWLLLAFAATLDLLARRGGPRAVAAGLPPAALEPRAGASGPGYAGELPGAGTGDPPSGDRSGGAA
ncbi:MAG TPA: O-antigen ligase family protein [Thermoanaerobaculia bacterium]|nr:O-antigen ligase family protein [Thermoanaerobaculia bacterium]